MAIITITNETGCGEVMYTNLAQKLNYKLFNRELMQYVATFSGMKHKDLELMDEKQYSWWNVMINNYFDFSLFTENAINEIEHKPSLPYEYDTSSPTGDNFKLATEKVIRKIASDDNAIIVGRGGNIILRDYPNVCNIFLYASINTRVNNISKSMKLSYKEALTYAKKTDEKKEKFVKYYYQENAKNMHNYHMILNLTKIDEKDASELVYQFIMQKK